MFRLLIAVLALAALLRGAAASHINYTGYKALRFPAASNNLTELSWHLKSLSAVELEAGPTELEAAVSQEATARLFSLGFTGEIGGDIGVAIAAEGPLVPFYNAVDRRDAAISPRALPDASWFKAYHPYEDHRQWLLDVQASFSQNSEVFTTEGQTFEGRPIEGIHLWGSGGKGSKPAVVWHGTAHAREWISTMTVEYLINQLVSGYATGDTTAFLDRYDFYVIPIANPDGFVYSQTTDRLWRKTRQVHVSPPPIDSKGCQLWDPLPPTGVGIDMNRNFPFMWRDWACSWMDQFSGISAGDAPEVQALVRYAASVNATRGIKSFIDWHSYGGIVMIPYGYEHYPKVIVRNYERQLALAGSTSAEINLVRGSNYQFGDIYEAYRDTATGCATDYFSDVAMAEFSWAIELPPFGRGIGGGGFLLSPEEILPVGNEIWAGVKYMLANM